MFNKSMGITLACLAATQVVCAHSLDASDAAHVYKRDPSVDFSPELYSAFYNRSGWLWYPVGEDNVGQPPATMGLRRTWSSPAGKAARNATILITVDNRFVLFVNDRAIGTPPSLQDIWFYAQKYHVALDETDNVFAVAAINDPSPYDGGNTPAGLRMAVEVQYEDGSREIFVSDSTRWKATNITSAVPSEWTFQNRDVDDSEWVEARVFRYGDLWDGVAVEVPYRPYGLTLNGSSWIWHNNTEASVVVFRRKLPISSRPIMYYSFLVAADSYFELYFNGQYVTSSTQVHDSWRFAERFTIPIAPNTNPLIAIVATRNHTSSPSTTGKAGLIAVIHVYYADGTWDVTRSEGKSGAWRVEELVSGLPALSPAFIDQDWAKAMAVGDYGIAPWGSDLLPVDAQPAGLLGMQTLSQAEPKSFASRITKLERMHLEHWIIGVIIVHLLALIPC